MVACNGDEDHEVEVTFESPTDGATIDMANAASVDIEIHFHIDEGELHDIEIQVYPTNDASDLIIDYDEHSHEDHLDFSQSVDLSSYDSGTSFTVKASVCADHDCSEKKEHTAAFSLN